MPDLVTRALEAVLVQVQGAASALVPIGTATAGSLVILSIVMLGTAMVSGQTALVRPVVSLCASSAGTLWAIATWPVIVGDTYHASEAILRVLTGGQGILGLYTLGGDVAARILAQGGAAIDGGTRSTPWRRPSPAGSRRPRDPRHGGGRHPRAAGADRDAAGAAVAPLLLLRPGVRADVADRVGRRLRPRAGRGPLHRDRAA